MNGNKVVTSRGPAKSQSKLQRLSQKRNWVKFHTASFGAALIRACDDFANELPDGYVKTKFNSQVASLRTLCKSLSRSMAYAADECYESAKGTDASLNRKDQSKWPDEFPVKK